MCCYSLFQDQEPKRVKILAQLQQRTLLKAYGLAESSEIFYKKYQNLSLVSKSERY